MLYHSLRFALLAGALFFATNAATAQDRIYLRDGSIIQAKVKEISPRTIVYRRWDNQEGADYILTRREVSRIVYQNGTEEKLLNGSERPNPFNRNASGNDESRTARGRAMSPGYGKNIIAFAPLQMTYDEGVAGVGVHFERFVDKAGMFALCLPVTVSFFDDPIKDSGRTVSRIFTYLYPGAKIYPGGSSRRASYSIGPSFGFGFGTKYKQIRTVDLATGAEKFSNKEISIFKGGFMVNNGLNIQPTKSFYIGLEFGIGIQYYNNEESDYVVGDKPMVQFNFKMGYRF